MADDTRKVRVEERLKIKIGEAKNLPVRSNGSQCYRDAYCVLSLDQEEIFRTSTLERTLNPFFGEEFQFEVPRRFRYLSIYVFDRDKHLRQDRVLGKVAIKREDLHKYNNKDHWFALRPVDADSEVQGKAYIELTLEDSRKRLRVEPKPPDPDMSTTADNSSAKTKASNLNRISEYCKESMKFGSCSNSTSKRLLSAPEEEPALSLSRSESLKDRAAWSVIRTKPPLHAMAEPDDESPLPTPADYWSDPERHCTARVGPDTLRLRVLECSELTIKNGNCDPFAIVTLLYSNGRKVERRTKPKKKTVNPQFDEIFCFDLVMEADPKDKDASQSAGVACEARVSVWHDAASPLFLGEVRLQLRQPVPTPFRAWYFLSSRSSVVGGRGATPPGTRLSAGAAGAALGSLRLLLQYTVDHVFPLHMYERLEKVLLDSVHLKPITTSAVYILGEVVASKTDAAQPLVRLFTHHDLIVPIVRELADAEISALTDATTIFRGNTLVSKMMDEAMRLTGASYLRSVLRPTLANVVTERKPCEIDPARVKPAAAVSTNLANLKDYVEKVFAAITSSYASCPPAMCRLFDALRQCAARHFPRNGEVRYSVVSGFIFLRFFAPAILGPRLFDLTTEQIDPQTNRTLTLISKTIQSLGNLVSSRSAQQVCKEEYMAELYKSFCTPRHVQAIRQFLEIISTSSDTHNNNVQESPVLLKEGSMVKKSEGNRGPSSDSPKRRWRPPNANSKRRIFKLTSGELSWSRSGSKVPTRRLSLSGVLALAALDSPPAGAPLGAANIFQIVHTERTLFIQASNCVERAEWVRLLCALCKLSAHRGYFCDNKWSCCGCTVPFAAGCVDADDERGIRLGALALRLDPARDLQRLHALLMLHSHALDERRNRKDADAELTTLRELQEAVFDLEHRHRIYRRSLARETKYGSKQAPIGDDNYLQLAGADAAERWLPDAYLRLGRLTRDCMPTQRLACGEYELMADFSSALRRTERPPPVPPRKPTHAPSDASLDQLREEAKGELKVSEDENDLDDIAPDPEAFSRLSVQRKSNPTKSKPNAAERLKTSNSTSNVHEAAGPVSRPLAERLTPFFLKKKAKAPPPDEPSHSKAKKEENLIGRLTPRFGRGRSLELPQEARRLERSPTSAEANVKFLGLSRFAAHDANEEEEPWRERCQLATQADIRL